MIGTGVLTTSGFTVYAVGSNQLMLALWVVGGLLAVCGALTLCELAAALPHSGGYYVYLREAYGPLAAFLSGWVSFLIGFGAPDRGLGHCVGPLFPGPGRPGRSHGQPRQTGNRLGGDPGPHRRA